MNMLFPRSKRIFKLALNSKYNKENDGERKVKKMFIITIFV